LRNKIPDHILYSTGKQASFNSLLKPINEVVAVTYSKRVPSKPESALQMESLYEQIGGAETIDRLVRAFYPKVYAHPELIPLFPEGVDEVRAKQYLFLTQFIGGPMLYTDRHGFGNMRTVHARFQITPARAEAWLSCMREAMDEIGLAGYPRQMFYQMLTNAAHRFVNCREDCDVDHNPHI
jgi:hemoglobin